ncbi:MAG: Smr/MutS family protein [Rhodospirillaceae bacterium]|nr:Smr/MutS family protein [Rhodospirillaceae bacterium]
MTKKPKTHKEKTSNPSIAEDDAVLWDGVAASVRVLEGREFMAGSADAQQLQKKLQEKPKTPPGKQPLKKTVQIKPPAPPALPAKMLLPELSIDKQPGLDKSTARKMARGQVKIESRLDLHGMTQDEASVALERFIENAYRNTKREVIVVTGKGGRTQGEIGVLRQMTPQWLNREPNRSRIVAFSHAAPKDGGEGALYVRIRKKKP